MQELYEQILDNDLNPYILFNSNGKLNNFNKEAEFLFNFVNPKELYELAIQNASQSYGFSSQFINLSYKKHSFYAILVGYLNDDVIALRLYKEVSPVKDINIDTNYHMSNIYTLINLSKTTSLSSSDIKIEEIYDVSIPELKIDINEFLLVMNSIFSSYINVKKLKLEVAIKTGEFELINEKRYHIICLKFSSDISIDINSFSYNKNSTINIFQKGNILEVEVPLIL